ncbi:glycosyltransferase family 4 protein [Neorhizobium galegae]|uniref:glycosyltransferase family 4 protein n=1 Tax=Neorhizobium galegae TaxID=399 RepID=UPI00210709AC|nr:glycosyltransferase family 4 protein [Neorhizobium galegae]MCQ1850768.1 glycosyltransferase family 4 protein [Neorhizobium galegae]
MRHEFSSAFPEAADTLNPSGMRILQLVTHDKMGGVRILVQMVETGLDARGFDVQTLSLDTGHGTVATLRNLARLAWAILSRKYDAIFTYQAAASVFGGFLGFLGRVPVRAAHHTAAPEGIRRHWKALDWLFGSTGIFTHFVSNSVSTSASFGKWPAAYRRRFILIPHGVDPIPPARAAVDWRQRLSIAPDAFVLVATGRLVDQKDHGVLVEALRLLPGMHLIIAGDGPNRAALEDKARALDVAERVHLVGSIDRDELGDILGAGNIYVFPSIWETFGLAGVEASMAGLPIVASDLPVLREVLCIGNGDENAAMTRFHPPCDATGLADAVKDLAANYPDAQLRSDFARLHREHHSRELMLERYTNFLRSEAG